MLSVPATALLLETCSSVTGPPGPQPLLGCRPCPAVARKLGGGWTQWAPTSSLPGAPASVHTHAPLSASGVGQLRPPPLAGSAGGPDQRFQRAPVDLASVARLSLRAPDRRHAPAVVTVPAVVSVLLSSKARRRARGGPKASPCVGRGRGAHGTCRPAQSGSRGWCVAKAGLGAGGAHSGLWVSGSLGGLWAGFGDGWEPSCVVGPTRGVLPPWAGRGRLGVGVRVEPWSTGPRTPSRQSTE